MHRLAGSILLLALLLPACRGDRVPLSYGLEVGRRLEYRLDLRADITRTLSDSTRRESVRAEFRATQEIQEALPGGGVRAQMTLAPTSLEVDERVADPGPAQGFTVELAADGRVVAIERTEGEAGEALQPVGLERLLPRLRPVLPGRTVATGETWHSETEFTDDEGRFTLATSSRLDRLGIVAGERAALVRTTYVSPVSRTDELANAVADLDGRDVGVQRAWFALDGFLIRATGDSVGRYAITFRPPPGRPQTAPVEGSLVVRLHTEMELV